MLSVVILKVVIVLVVAPQIEVKVKKTPLDLNRIGRIWSFMNIFYFKV
jgi:hypothetical protein